MASPAEIVERWDRRGNDLPRFSHVPSGWIIVNGRTCAYWMPDGKPLPTVRNVGPVLEIAS